LGKHDGQISGKRYFKCPARFGLFAPLHHVEKVALTAQDIQKLNRQSTISTDSNNQYLDSASQDSNLSEFSTSSKSLNDFPTRSPKKIKQPDLSAIETSLSSEIKQLHEVIKEKDLSLEKLQREYAIKENENENLIKERLELTQHVEELQFQLQENQSTIPDDHRLLSLEEMSVYEKTEEKIVKLELINKKLLQEKQMFEEQLKRYNEVDDKRTDTLTDELNKQIALLRLQITDLENKGIDHIRNSILF
jgi:chromosome segregation ATPase